MRRALKAITTSAMYHRTVVKTAAAVYKKVSSLRIYLIILPFGLILSSKRRFVFNMFQFNEMK